MTHRLAELEAPLPGASQTSWHRVQMVRLSCSCGKSRDFFPSQVPKSGRFECRECWKTRLHAEKAHRKVSAKGPAGSLGRAVALLATKSSQSGNPRPGVATVRNDEKRNNAADHVAGGPQPPASVPPDPNRHVHHYIGDRTTGIYHCGKPGCPQPEKTFPSIPLAVGRKGAAEESAYEYRDGTGAVHNS